MKLSENCDVITDLVFSPVEPLLISGGLFGEVALWDVEKGVFVEFLAKHHGISKLSLNSLGLLAYQSGRLIYLWDVKQRILLSTFPYEDRANIAWSPDNKTLAVGGKTVKLLDSTTAQIQKTLAIEDLPSGFGRVAWHPNGKFLVTGSYHQKNPFICIWDLEKDHFRKFDGFLAGKIVFSGEKLFFTQPYGKIYSLDLATYKIELAFWGEEKQVEGAEIKEVYYPSAIHPNGRLAAYVQTIGVKKYTGQHNLIYQPLNGYPLEGVYLTDIYTGKDLVTFPVNFDQDAGEIAFSSDGHYLAASSHGGLLYSWNISSFIE